MSSKLEIILNYYNNISAFSTCLWKSTTALARFDSPFGGTNLHLPDGEALAWHVHDDALAS